MGKLLVVVVNDALMENHQRELADAMAKRMFLLATTPSDLATALNHLDSFVERRQEYSAPRPEAFAALVDEEMATAQDGGIR